MADVLQTGVASLLSTIQAHASQTVDYESEFGVVTGVQATLGETEVEEQSGLSIVQSKRRDYIFQASDLAIDGEKFQPKEGDVVVDTTHNLRCKVVVLGSSSSWGQTESSYMYLDPYRQIIRVHTVVIEDNC